MKDEMMPHEKQQLARNIISDKDESIDGGGGQKLDRVECETCDGGGYVTHAHYKAPERKGGKNGEQAPYEPGKHVKVAHNDHQSAIAHMSKLLAKHAGK